MERTLFIGESESQDFKESLNHRRRSQYSGDYELTLESLSDVPGVGDKVKEALIEHFGSEALALKVIHDSRVDLIAAVPGIGSRQAVNLVKGAFEKEFGASSNMLLRSQDIRKIYESSLDIIRA